MEGDLRIIDMFLRERRSIVRFCTYAPRLINPDPLPPLQERFGRSATPCENLGDRNRPTRISDSVENKISVFAARSSCAARTELRFGSGHLLSCEDGASEPPLTTPERSVWKTNASAWDSTPNQATCTAQARGRSQFLDRFVKSF
jgi:hypothetical protein